MEGVNNGQLRTWVAAWAAEYDKPHDAQLTELWGAEHLTRRSMEILIGWKFVAMPHRRARADRALGEEADQAIVDITAAARRCVDDGAALRVVRTLGGVGSALGSAALMVMDPTRWTVLDVRALKSIRAIGYTDIPTSPQATATWPPYLNACRDLATHTGASLRTVDRALFAAAGRRDLPVDA